MKLEVVVLPVFDVDRAKHFYQNLGWRLDGNLTPAADFRVVQFTQPASLAAIRFGTGRKDVAPRLSVNLSLPCRTSTRRVLISRPGAWT
jgi:catechol 2,3-dioxygenase-like lactoylglutathione lyase family enzyme